MRKSIETTNEGLFDIGGLAVVKSIKGSQRKKLLNDSMYYIRKLLKLLRQLQAIPEGVEDLELARIKEELKVITREVDNIEHSLNRY